MKYEKYYWLNEESRKFLSRGYLKDGVTPEQRIKNISSYAEKIINVKGFAQKFENYMERGFYSLSSPVWSNFGYEKSLPISCYGTHVDDSMDSILNANREVGLMTKYGGGTSMYLGNIRARGTSITAGGVADGPVHYARITDSIVDVCKQGDTRRGACAVYLPLEHGDISEFLEIGGEGHPIQNLQFGVTVTDAWLNSMIDGDETKRIIWAKVLEKRNEIGFPYILFKDNANNHSPYHKLGLDIVASNLCTEIMLPSDTYNSFVCCLGSINLLHWREIKETDAIEVYVQFLNAVIEDFIKKSEYMPGMKRAWRFAKDHRAIGLGVLGYHSFLQSEELGFQSLKSKYWNNDIFSTLKERSDNASKWCNEYLGYKSIREGFANTTLLAIAPTKSSSFILGQVSMGIEPIKSNYFIKDLAKIKDVYKNKSLGLVLDKYMMNTPETWGSILNNDGSVQHLEFLSDNEKEIYKSFIEISPKEIILQAAQRQKFIDQGQSLNLMIHPSVLTKEINKLYIYAWKEGIKSLYYQFSQSAAQSFSREINKCESCES